MGGFWAGFCEGGAFGGCVRGEEIKKYEKYDKKPKTHKDYDETFVYLSVRGHSN